MPRNPGYLCKTLTGKTAACYNRAQKDAPVGKVFITMLNDDFSPVLDENGKPVVKVCDPNNLKVIGYLD